MTLVESPLTRGAAAASAGPVSASVLDQALAQLRWTLTDAARLDLAGGDSVDGGRLRGTFAVVLDGEVQVLFDGTTCRLRAGDVLLRAHPASVHLHAIDDATLVIGSLDLADDAGHPLLRLLPEALVACGLLATDPQVRALADMLVAEIRSDRPGSALLSGGIAGLLAAAALRAWVENGCAPDGWLDSCVDPDIARVVDAIRDDPGGRWTLDRLARLAHTSRSAFAERFRAAVGDSPARYLTRVRMERAKGMLTAGRVSVAQAATRSGYGSDAAFSRAFSRHTGVTPSAWRRGAATVTAADVAAEPAA